MHGSIADPAQLAILRSVVHAYCDKHDIVDPAARDWVAGQVLDLFFLGVIEPDALARELERRSSELRHQVASVSGGSLLRQGDVQEALFR